MMVNLERKIGPFRIRAYGLVVNFLANFVALYGLTQVLAGTGGYPILIGGVVTTIGCLAALSTPSQGEN